MAAHLNVGLKAVNFPAVLPSSWKKSISCRGRVYTQQRQLSLRTHWLGVPACGVPTAVPRKQAPLFR